MGIRQSATHRIKQTKFNQLIQSNENRFTEIKQYMKYNKTNDWVDCKCGTSLWTGNRSRPYDLTVHCTRSGRHQNFKKEKYSEKIRTILLLLTLIGIIMFIVCAIFVYSNILNEEDKCVSFLREHDLIDMWPKLIEAKFDDIRLWKDITSDMLDKMNITDSDKIRFSHLQKQLKEDVNRKHSHTTFKYIIELIENMTGICFGHQETVASVVSFVARVYRNS